MLSSANRDRRCPSRRRPSPGGVGVVVVARCSPWSRQASAEWGAAVDGRGGKAEWAAQRRITVRRGRGDGAAVDNRAARQSGWRGA